MGIFSFSYGFKREYIGNKEMFFKATAEFFKNLRQ